MQGSHYQGKTWKIVKAFSRSVKIREFEKDAIIMDKSRNLKIPPGKIREKFVCLIVGGECVAVRGGMEATF